MAALRHCLPLLALLTRTAAQIFGCDDPAVLPASADGRQNPAGAHHGYVEWWFFTTFSPKSDVGLALSYNAAHRGVSAMVYLHASHPARASVEHYHASFSTVTSTPDNATAHWDASNNVVVVDEKTYIVRGSMGGASWTLRYEQAVDACREHVDILKNFIKLDWVAYMPSAKVTGTLTLNGTTFDLSDATGYHDHNSGRVSAASASESPTRKVPR